MTDLQTCRGFRQDGERCSEWRALDAQGLCYHHRGERQLTDRRQAFITEYVKDCNGAAAAIRAGYARSGARQEASRLLSDADIRKAIDERLAAANLSSIEIVALLKGHALASITPFIRVVENKDGSRTFKVDLTSDEAQANYHLIKELRFDQYGQPIIKLHDAQAAMVHLAKIAGLFIDKVEHQFTERKDLRDFMDDWNEMSVEARVEAMRQTMH